MDSLLEEKILKASVKQIYEASKVSVFGLFVMLFFVGFLLFGKIPNSVLIEGFVFHFTLLIWRVYNIYKYFKSKRSPDNTKDAKYWLIRYKINTFLIGTGWGLLLFFLNGVSVEYQLVIYIVIIGLATAGLYTLGTVLSVYLSFVLPILSLNFVWLLMQGGIIHPVLAALMIVWATYSYVMARSFSENFKKIIIEKEKNRTYTQELEERHEELKELEERMELALIGSNDGLWDWNLVDNSVYFSTRWKDMLGFDENSSMDEYTNWEDRIHPDDVAQVAADIQANIDGKTEFYENVHRLRHKDGHWVWILDRGKTHYDENGKPVRMIGTHTDITEEKEMQLKYIHQAQIIEQVHDSVISVTLEGIIISWNIGSELLLGYKAHEMIGKHISFIYPEKEYRLLKEGFDAVLKNEKFSAEVRLIKKSNKVLPAELTLTLLKDANAKAVGIICYAQDITEQKLAQAKLRYQAHYDSLTDLPNRTLFNDRLRQGIEKARRNGMNLALLFIDLDKFKQINDTLGHDVGDIVLKFVTNRLKLQLRKGDTLARLGGDEFIIIMEDLEKEKDASLLAQKILDTLQEPINTNGHTLYVSSSIGISTFPRDSTDPYDLLKYADVAMYKAKEEGRNNFQFYSREMTKLVFERVMMEANLREALKNNEFVTYYQPQINAKTGKIVGMEALVRWKHQALGLIFPSKFISLAEENGLILDIDQFMMKTAMKQIRSWYDDGLNPGVLALNLTVKQLEKDGFLDTIKSCLKEYRFKPEWLELEITEGEIMTKMDSSIAKLQEINNLGIRVAIDDFGTGYSSLSYLKKLPIDKLKIDQSFVKDTPDDEEDSAIVKAIIALAKSLNLDMIAEGVESDAQKQFLLKNGCNNIQGHYYSRAISADEMYKYLLQSTPLSKIDEKIKSLTKTSKLYSREDILSNTSIIPLENGFYSFFFKNLPSQIPVKNCFQRDGFFLLFIGSVPARKISTSNLRKSIINQHLKGNISNSTLRFSLACLLKKQLNLSFSKNKGKIYLSSDEEKKIDKWLDKNMKIAYLVDNEPWNDKVQIIQKLDLPLNIEHNKNHQFCSVLKKLRFDARKNVNAV